MGLSNFIKGHPSSWSYASFYLYQISRASLETLSVFILAELVWQLAEAATASFSLLYSSWPAYRHYSGLTDNTSTATSSFYRLMHTSWEVAVKRIITCQLFFDVALGIVEALKHLSALLIQKPETVKQLLWLWSFKQTPSTIIGEIIIDFNILHGICRKVFGKNQGVLTIIFKHKSLQAFGLRLLKFEGLN